MNKRVGRISIVIEVSDEDSQPLDDTGLTEAAYLRLMDALASIDAAVVSVEPDR